MLLSNILNSILFSPLEQFDNVTWVQYNLLIEALNLDTISIFDYEINPFQTVVMDAFQTVQSGAYWDVNNTTFNSNFVFGLDKGSVTNIIILGSIIYVLTKKNYEQFLPEFSHMWLFALLHLVAGSFLYFWFADFFYVSNVELLNQGVSFAKESFTQLSFRFAFDELTISFILAFFFFSGAEEEEDEDFLLEEEEADFGEDIVANLFLTNLGKNVEDNGALFLKVCGVFSFVLINNVMGMLPYADTATAGLVLTFWVALAVFVSILTLMIRKHGVNYFFSLFMPSGCPLPLLFLLIPIEFISYSFRLVSLAVRLFANMMAGHTLMKVILGFSWSLILAGDVFLLVNLFPLAIVFVLVFLELGVALIQAYIFTVLICIYLNDIFVAHH